MIEEDIKLCKRCNTIKKLSEFWRDVTKKDKHQTVCIACKKEKKRKPVVPEGMKLCTKCKQVKNLSDFSIRSHNKNGHRVWCKECGSKDTIRWQRSHPSKYIQKMEKWKKFNPALVKYYNIKSNCSHRKISFNLDQNEFIEWYKAHPKVCCYCGVSETFLKRPLTIDRVNNDIGYQLDNIVWACHICNLIKGNIFSEIEMKEIGQRYIKQKYIYTKVSGTKNDQSGKLRTDLLPIYPLEELARVYTIGAAKYGDRNYLKGMEWSRIYAALLRHIFKWWKGEKLDPEDGQHHLASVAWNAFTLLEYENACPHLDDRPQEGKINV